MDKKQIEKILRGIIDKHVEDVQQKDIDLND